MGESAYIVGNILLIHTIFSVYTKIPHIDKKFSKISTGEQML